MAGKWDVFNLPSQIWERGERPSVCERGIFTSRNYKRKKEPHQICFPKIFFKEESGQPVIYIMSSSKTNSSAKIT